MTQTDRTLERLKNGGWFPMPEALQWSPPITRLGARICDSRHDGHNIIERRVPAKATANIS
jgi:hypothetical protein